jgi:hypothetical protein
MEKCEAWLKATKSDFMAGYLLLAASTSNGNLAL